MECLQDHYHERIQTQMTFKAYVAQTVETTKSPLMNELENKMCYNHIILLRKLFSHKNK